MKIKNVYKDVITIISNNDINWKALVIKIAQDNPSILCKAYEAVYKIDSLHLAILNELKQNKKIAAIKLYKEHTGKGLRESKEYIDSLVNNTKKEIVL